LIPSLFSASNRNTIEERLPRVVTHHRTAVPATVRVLHVHSGNLYGGVETTLLAQARHQDLCPAIELSFALCFAGRFSRELEAAGAPLYMLGEARARNPLTIRRVRHRLADLLRREKFDVVVAHSAWSQAIFGPVARANGQTLAFWLHSPASGHHWLERWASRTPPDIVICNSRFTASTLSKIYPQTRAEVIYNPLISSESSPSEAERKKMRASLDTPEDAVVIVQVSRMEPWKGHTLHLQALELLKDCPGWFCWQVGGAQTAAEARYMEGLKKLTASSGLSDRVRFLGQRADVPALLAAADIHCQPNTGPEPFGHTFVEALAARLPVVTTAVGGATEIVDDSCGLLVPPGCARALSEALRRLIEDRALRLKLGENGPARARQLCDVSTQMRLVAECFVQVCR
jgi:glycosyltransferase involved in cell wall biosynthesis